MITIEYLQYEGSYKGYNELSGYLFLDTTGVIGCQFNDLLEYRDGEPEPFSDKESESFLEYISSIQPYKSHGFRRTGTFAFSADGVIYNLTNLDPNMKAVLLILKYREDTKYNGIIINPCFLESEPYRWLAGNYDLSLCIKPSDILHSKFSDVQNTEFVHAGEKIDNIEEWLVEKTRHKRYDATSSYARCYDDRVIGVYLDKPATFRDFCAILNKDTLFRLETHEIDPFCDNYLVLIEGRLFNAQVREWENPILYGIIEKDGKGRFVQSNRIDNANVQMVFDTIVRLFKDENADIMNIIVSSEFYEDIDVIDYKNVLQSITINRNFKAIFMNDWYKAEDCLHQAMERADIPLDAQPEKLRRH